MTKNEDQPKSEKLIVPNRRKRGLDRQITPEPAHPFTWILEEFRGLKEQTRKRAEWLLNPFGNHPLLRTMHIDYDSLKDHFEQNQEFDIYPDGRHFTWEQGVIAYKKALIDREAAKKRTRELVDLGMTELNILTTRLKNDNLQERTLLQTEHSPSTKLQRIIHKHKLGTSLHLIDYMANRVVVRETDESHRDIQLGFFAVTVGFIQALADKHVQQDHKQQKYVNRDHILMYAFNQKNIDKSGIPEFLIAVNATHLIL